MYSYKCVILVTVLLYGVFSLPVLKTKFSPIPSHQSLNFMKRYGYLEPDTGNSGAIYSEEGLSETIKLVQKFGGIKQTGKIDNATIELMSQPRCGVQDIIKSKRKRRFILGPKGWEKRQLTYFLANWSPKLDEFTVAKNIQKALDIWSQYGRLSFRRIMNPNADIIVAFARGVHGDSYPFDGPGKVLAHAFFPNDGEGGDIHFDDDEDWVDKKLNNDDTGTDFFTVALHELGHSLGLAHSYVPSAVMFPYYKGFDNNDVPGLDYDDILGIYELYVRRRLLDDDINEFPMTNPSVTTSSSEATTVLNETPPSTPTTIQTTEITPGPSSDGKFTYVGDDESVEDHLKHDKTHMVPGKDKENDDTKVNVHTNQDKTNVSSGTCSNMNICCGKFDTIATLRNELFVFKNQNIWRFKEKGQLVPGYPVPLRQMFPKLPKSVKKIDAAYQRPDGIIILFTGKIYWVFDGTNFIENSPKPLTNYGLPDHLTNIDAVQTWAKNGKTYFYKQNHFWRYNEGNNSMDPGYPLHMERWRNIPENLDAATTWKDDVTYFFKNGLFWKFDNDWVMATETSPFPTVQLWFGCPEESNMLQLLNAYE